MFTAGAKVLCHLVKGFNQAPKFIIAHWIDRIAEITIGHPAGSFDQLLNRKADRSGHKKPKPHSAKQNQQGNNRERYIIRNLNRFFEQLDLLVFGIASSNKLQVF